MPRIAQLTQRTNQFNNTTIRRTEPEVRRGLESGEVQCIAVEVRDRFGDYGLVGAAFYETRADALWVETLLMSCRALGRGVEHRSCRPAGRDRAGSRSRPGPHPIRPDREKPASAPVLPGDRCARRGHRPSDGQRERPSGLRADAGDASRVTYDPTRSEGELAPQDVPEETEPSAGRMSPFRLDTTRLSAIATTVDSAEQILARMSAAARRRPRAAPTEYVAPRSPIEETLADMWAKALRVDHVGVLDDFFELGGSSLQATMLVNRLQKALDTFVRVDHGVRRAHRGWFRRASRAAAHGTAQGEPTGRVFYWRAERATFVRAAAVVVSRPVRSWQHRLQRAACHSASRISSRRGARWCAQRRGRATRVLAHHVSSDRWSCGAEGCRDRRSSASDHGSDGLPATDRVREAVRLVALEADRPFDLATGPLFRAGVVRLDEDDHVLWFVFHHIVADGSSVRILVQEIEALYHLRLGVGDMLPAVRMQYLEFASWQRELLKSDALAGQKAYWQRQLADPPVLELPADHPRPPIISYRGSSVPVVIPAELVQELRVIGQRQRATLFMTLMAAFHVLLARYTGQDDIVVGFPIANRQELEVEGLIGFLVNTLPLRVDLSGDPPFDEVLRRVRQRAVEAYTHQDVPFEQLVEDVVPERDLARTPIFQAMLALLDDPIGRGRSAGSLGEPC